MPRHSSDEIYYLVHSLSQSELIKLREDLAKTPSSSIPKGSTPLYLQLIEFLLTQKKYDDKVAKARFGYEEVNSSGWRVLKKKAVDQAIRAIELAKENQTDYAVLHRIPMILRHLIDRGIYQRAEAIGKKYLQIAIQKEQFHLVSELVEIMQLLIVQCYSTDTALSKIEDIQVTRREANDRNHNLENLQEIWFKLHVESKRSFSSIQPDIQDILENPIIANKDAKSQIAEMYYWKVRKRCYFLMRNYEKYIQTLDNGIQFCENGLNILRSEFFDFYIGLLTDRGRIALLAHEFNIASDFEEKMQDLVQKKSLSGQAKSRIQGKIYRFQLTRHYSSFNLEKLKSAVGFTSKWLISNRGLLDVSTSIGLHRMLATYYFIFGDYSEASKWVFSLRSKIESSISAFAWAFYLMARLQNGDYEIIAKEAKATRDFFSNSSDGFIFFSKIANFVIELAKEKKDNPRLIEEFKDELQNHPSYPKYSNYFPFSLWLDSKIGKGQIWVLLQASNKPIRNL
jgi:hypothetical protein